MDVTKFVIYLIANAVIVVSCFKFINDVLKENKIMCQLEKWKNYLFRVLFGLMILLAQYNVIYYRGASLIDLASISLLAGLLFVIYHFHKRYIFPLIPDEIC